MDVEEVRHVHHVVDDLAAVRALDQDESQVQAVQSAE